MDINTARQILQQLEMVTDPDSVSIDLSVFLQQLSQLGSNQTPSETTQEKIIYPRNALNLQSVLMNWIWSEGSASIHDLKQQILSMTRESPNLQTNIDISAFLQLLQLFDSTTGTPQNIDLLMISNLLNQISDHILSKTDIEVLLQHLQSTESYSKWIGQLIMKLLSASKKYTKRDSSSAMYEFLTSIKARPTLQANVIYQILNKIKDNKFHMNFDMRKLSRLFKHLYTEWDPDNTDLELEVEDILHLMNFLSKKDNLLEKDTTRKVIDLLVLLLSLQEKSDSSQLHFNVTSSLNRLIRLKEKMSEQWYHETDPNVILEIFDLTGEQGAKILSIWQKRTSKRYKKYNFNYSNRIFFHEDFITPEEVQEILAYLGLLCSDFSNLNFKHQLKVRDILALYTSYIPKESSGELNSVKRPRLSMIADMEREIRVGNLGWMLLYQAPLVTFQGATAEGNSLFMATPILAGFSIFHPMNPESIQFETILKSLNNPNITAMQLVALHREMLELTLRILYPNTNTVTYIQPMERGLLKLAGAILMHAVPAPLHDWSKDHEHHQARERMLSGLKARNVRWPAGKRVIMGRRSRDHQYGLFMIKA
ncbi:hypothetical protein Pcinc_021615 [Petrolisthes cinctipes]|uniref:Uncharacterized protein n=1 Tax=Petrolisthes cinctipes TaxID=88211 RepID=A0AAE1FGG9_PETCI|nr:hypothetical protein Pcinc_021615 [Petrolisthes cinctipes]